MKGAASAALAATLLLGAGFGVSRLQPALAGTVHKTKAREDVYVLPPPAQLRAFSLGYHAATTDLLWAKLLVEYGVHHHEHREFPDIENYLDAILALEPDYAPAYTYLDTIIIYRPPRGYDKDARTVRRYLERGLAARPRDYKVWQTYGDFLAFVAPSFLDDQEESARWRKEGAMALERAVNLGASNARGVTAAALLSRSGERASSIRQLRAAAALTDDPTERENILERLQALEASEERDAVERAVKYFEKRWSAELPHVGRTLYLLVGPVPDAARCTGPASVSDVAQCARSWRDVAEARQTLR